jgi:hypothetical protein
MQPASMSTETLTSNPLACPHGKCASSHPSRYFDQLMYIISIQSDFTNSTSSPGFHCSDPVTRLTGCRSESTSQNQPLSYPPSYPPRATGLATLSYQNRHETHFRTRSRLMTPSASYLTFLIPYVALRIFNEPIGES